MTPASGGALLNGSLLIQQGAYAAVRNANARVRLAAAVSGGLPVAASSSDGTVIDSGVAPAFGFYTLVPASSSLNVTVNSASVAVAAPATLVAGGDATLLVYNGSGGPAAKLIPDDNRPPTSTTATKLRLINGITGNVGTVTLTANSSPVGINIAPGFASSYQSLIGTANTAGTANTFGFGLTSSLAGPLSLTNGSATGTVNSNAAYSILAVGDVGAQPLQLLIR
jgi:hypothetical protein